MGRVRQCFGGREPGGLHCGPWPLPPSWAPARPAAANTTKRKPRNPSPRRLLPRTPRRTDRPPRQHPTPKRRRPRPQSPTPIRCTSRSPPRSAPATTRRREPTCRPTRRLPGRGRSRCSSKCKTRGSRSASGWPTARLSDTRQFSTRTLASSRSSCGPTSPRTTSAPSSPWHGPGSTTGWRSTACSSRLSWDRVLAHYTVRGHIVSPLRLYA